MFYTAPLGEFLRCIATVVIVHFGHFFDGRFFKVTNRQTEEFPQILDRTRDGFDNDDDGQDGLGFSKEGVLTL